MNNKIRITLSKILILISSLSIFSQNIPPPPKSDDDVVKISVNLVQLDVTVTDKKGNVVKDLTQNDFEIYENDKKQDISNLSFVESVIPVSTQMNNSGAKSKEMILPPPVSLTPDQVRRTYALIVDDLGLSFENIYFVRKSIEKFVDEQMQDGDLVAILRVSRGIGALQSFTSDRRLLKQAANKLRWNPNSRGGIGSYDPIRTSLEQELDGTKRSDGTVRSVQGINETIERESRNSELYDSRFASGTIGAISYVIRGMNSLPGRKSLMLFSEGFPMLSNSSSLSSGRKIPEINIIGQYLRALAELANRSSVTIHTIDPRGLTIPDFMATAADDVLPSATSSAQQLAVRDFKKREMQNSLRYLAEETGGIAYVEQNNINKGIAKVLEYQNRGYYLIAYEPNEETFDSKKSRFNKISIRVKRPGLQVRYRSGFFGVSDEKYNSDNRTPQQKLAAALVSPFGSKDLNIDLYSIFYNDSQNRNFIRSFVYIDPKDLTFSLAPDGTYQAKFDIVGMIFDTNGAAATNGIYTQSLKFTKEEFAIVKRKGLLYNLTVPIDKYGGYQFRVALQDVSSGRIGAASQYIELPDLKKKRLTLSSVIIKNYTLDQWKKISLGENDTDSSDKSILLDTVTRQFRQGTVLTYYFVIYNAKTDAGQKPKLELQTRLYREGKMILEGQPSPIEIDDQGDLQRVQFHNAVTLGNDLPPGEYSLQLIVSDKLVKGKNQYATQAIDFEIIK